MTDVVDLVGAKFFPVYTNDGAANFIAVSKSVSAGDVIMLEGEGGVHCQRNHQQWVREM